MMNAERLSAGQQREIPKMSYSLVVLNGPQSGITVQLDADHTGVGGVLPTKPIPRSKENLQAFVDGVLQFHERKAEHEAGAWIGEPPPDVELDFAKDILIDMIVEARKAPDAVIEELHKVAQRPPHLILS